MTTILVIMPIGSDPEFLTKQNVIQDVIEKAGLQVQFPEYDPADPLFSQAEFTKELLSSNAVLADLSGERPSCYYELGFAEALHRPVHLIAEQNTVIHQSAYRDSVQFYSDMISLASAVSKTLGLPRDLVGKR